MALLRQPCSSYDLPHRVHTAKVYPVPSPNGSTIVIYGHEHGIRVLWRGGRSFKPPSDPPKQDKSASNGVNNDSIMILDSDEEDIPANPGPSSQDEAKFEEIEEPRDPGAPYSPVLQHLDLALGTNVLHLSCPNIASGRLQAPYSSLPSILSQKVVLVAGCSDNTVRLVTLPLMPPIPASKERDGVLTHAHDVKAGLGRWGEQVIVVGGQSAFQDIPNAVDLKMTPRDGPLDDEKELEGEDGEERRTTRSMSRQRPSSSRGQALGEDQEWELLIAAHSPETSGLLLLFKAPIVNVAVGTAKEYLVSTEHVSQVQAQHLLSPASSISFNPAPHPSRRHSQLMVVDGNGSVKIYECMPPPSKGSRPSSRRRSSFLETPNSEQGSWLLTLHPGFEKPKPSDATTEGNGRLRYAQRKAVLDAKWVFRGKGILTLMSDGEWGVWDIEGAGPMEEGKGGQVGRGLHGAAKTVWSLSGWVGERQSRRKKETTTAFAPRTPHTRQREEKRLFSGGSNESSNHGRGGLAVRTIASARADTLTDEAIVIWHDSSIAAMPSLRGYWETQLARNRNGGSLVSADGRDRLLKFDGVKLRGELISDTDIFPSSTEPKPRLSPGMPEVLISTEHRLVILSSPAPKTTPDSDAQQEARPDVTDQQLMALGGLELDGIDRMLADMDRGMAAKRKVNFLQT